MMWLGGTLALFLIGIIVVVSIVRETREIPFPDHPGKRLRPGGRGAC